MNIEKQDKVQKIYFNSLEEFYRYIKETPFNGTFENSILSSEDNDERWCGTKSFEEACDLFKNGWTEMTEKLNNKLNVKGNFEQSMCYKDVVSVQGYHPVVPLYLMGVPNNMITKKMVPMKQKVVNINKCLNYSSKIKTETIIDESIKAFRIIQKLERQNYRVNLNLIIGVADKYEEREKYFIKIRLKSSNEKLNISKLSFPLVHPSMLRRLYLRFVEVHPGIGIGFKYGYGVPIEPNEMRKVYPNDILLPQFIAKNIEKINTLEDLENL